VTIYLTEVKSDLSKNVIFPKVGFGSPITTPFSWSPGAEDWTYNAPKCTTYVVPTGSESIAASSFIVDFDPTKATLTATAGDLFDGGIFYSQTTGQGRLKINTASLSSTINAAPGSDKYLARLIFTLLKPGNFTISLDSLDFRQYDIQTDEQVSLLSESDTCGVKFYLGDFVSATSNDSGDGQIDIEDLVPFATSYWSNYAQQSTLYKSKFDVGPTNSSGNYFALPTPDGNVNFEDLVIFAVGYNKYHNGDLPKENINVTVSLGKAFSGSTFRVPIVLGGNFADLRAFSFTFSSSLKLVGIEKAGNFDSDRGFVIAKQEENKIYFDAAIIGGDGISEAGEIAYLVFENEGEIEFENAIARNSSNLDVMVQYKKGGELNDLPESFSLLQNYPNPFNPLTVISFELPEASKVTLQVFNTLGEEVAVLANGEQFQAGSQQKSFDAGKLTSGMYLYKITTSNFTATKKMMLIK